MNMLIRYTQLTNPEKKNPPPWLHKSAAVGSNNTHRHETPYHHPTLVGLFTKEQKAKWRKENWLRSPVQGSVLPCQSLPVTLFLFSLQLSDRAQSHKLLFSCSSWAAEWALDWGMRCLFCRFCRLCCWSCCCCCCYCWWWWRRKEALNLVASSCLLGLHPKAIGTPHPPYFALQHPSKHRCWKISGPSTQEKRRRKRGRATSCCAWSGNSHEEYSNEGG